MNWADGCLPSIANWIGLIVAGTEEDDVAALPRVIERYPPDAVLWSGNTQASFSSRVLNEYLSLQDFQVTKAELSRSWIWAKVPP